MQTYISHTWLSKDRQFVILNDILAQHLSSILIIFSSPSQNEQKVPISSFIKEKGIPRYTYLFFA